MSGGGKKSGEPRKRAAGARPSVRLFLLVSALTFAALLAAAAMGYDLVRQGDERVLLWQRRLLQSAIAQLDKDRPLDARAAAAVTRSVALPGLAFDTGPDGREQQAVIDGHGRIVGFFHWDAPQSKRQFEPLALLVAGIVAALLLFAAVLFWQLRRVRRRLAVAETQAARAAEADKLTGLPNHAKMLELLERALTERSREESIVFAVIEVDGLEDAQAGALGTDELIVTVAQRLHEALPEQAVCGRIGTAQFAVLLPLAAGADAQAILRATLDAIARPYWIDKVVRLTGQAGFAQAPLHATSRSELTRRAELALRSAAKKGPGTLAIFEPAIDQASSEQKFIQRELPRALAANELEPHFQPIVSAAGGAVVGVEALLRWTHAGRGTIPPGTFIPVAEQMGLMDQLGSFVLRRALQEVKRWPDLYVAVNLSPLQVRHPGIVETVRAALAEAAVPPSRLMLEITEGVLIDNPDEMVRRIGDLHALGLRIALDDFGAGYCNLGYLQRFPLDKLKIDKSFVDALGQSDDGGVILQAMVALGRALGLSVTAEGVETEQQRVLLRLAGCDEMQGYLFSKPAPAKDIDRMLKASARPKAAPQSLTA